MVDPLSLGALGGVALTEGIKFLYGQVTELLKRHRDRAEKAADQAAEPVVPAGEHAALDGALTPRPVDEAVVEANQARLLELLEGLGNYAIGLRAADPADHRLVDRVAALRGLLELAYGQHVTFRGEQRAASGSPLEAGAPAAGGSYVATVTASGPGGVVVGGPNQGNITTTTTYYAQSDAAPGSAPAGG